MDLIKCFSDFVLYHQGHGMYEHNALINESSWPQFDKARCSELRCHATALIDQGTHTTLRSGGKQTSCDIRVL